MAIDWQVDSEHAHLREHERRMNGVKYLFDAWGLEPTREQVRIYMTETQDIPFWFFRRAVKAVIGSHKWAKPPTIAEIRAAAENLAGMDRERYHAGKYLPPVTTWPIDGMRHAVNAGALERAERAALTIGPCAEIPAVTDPVTTGLTLVRDELGGMF